MNFCCFVGKNDDIWENVCSKLNQSDLKAQRANGVIVEI